MSHAQAVERSIKSGNLAQSDRHAALVELCRILALQMDDASDKPTTHLCAAYLSALKDLERALGAKKVETKSSRLGQLRAVNQRSA